MKISDYIFKFLEHKGVKHVFMLPGNGCMQLVDSLGKNRKIEYICCYNEQAVAIAAEGYGQITGDIGVGLVSGGSGVTNAVTGVTAAYEGSTPCIIISGQDELCMSNVIDIIKPVTKMAEIITDPFMIKYYLESAYYTAMSGRKGPVWLEIPVNLQNYEIEEEDIEEMDSFVPPSQSFGLKIDNIIGLLKKSKRPCVLAGNGIRIASGKSIEGTSKVRDAFLSRFGSGATEIDVFLAWAEKINIPVLSTWKTKDMFNAENPLYFGSVGLYGHRGANYIIQNCDLLLIIGSSIDSCVTAKNGENFAKNAVKIVVNIDEEVIQKLKPTPDFALTADAGAFVRALYVADMMPYDNQKWLDYCKRVYNKYPAVLPEYKKSSRYINTYNFIDLLSGILSPDDIIIPESWSTAGEITYQAFNVKKGQKIRSVLGLGGGFGLATAVGACIANNKRRTVLITGDGSFQFNIQELQTIRRCGLPVKIFVFSNNAHANIMNLQRDLYDGFYVASNPNSGITMPNISRIAEAYAIKAFTINDMNTNELLQSLITEALDFNGPVLCEFLISPLLTAAPRIQTLKQKDGSIVTDSLENMWPYLEPEEIADNMPAWDDDIPFFYEK